MGKQEIRARIAMSGGVDSAVAALLLQREGCACEGVTMRLYREEVCRRKDRGCCSDADEEDAAVVCSQRVITPGQAVVLYEGDLLLGGGTILEP